ncbi:MAG: hypothetical protein GY783_03205 [Gammaproteobacteria bacterium]|nr:hypothetical protein [Gammaproteobacteria bacterium]
MSERDQQLQAFLAELLDDSVSEILTHEDAEHYLQWVTEKVLGRSKRETGFFESTEEAVALATNFGRSIWNAFPLPGNGFRPRPLAMPGRNEPCPCGSGRKFKRCCGYGPAAPGLDAGILWPLLIGKLPASILDEAVAEGRIPIEAVIGAALDQKDRDRPKLAVKLLEPLFDAPIDHCDEDGEFAFDLLCNLYDDLGYSKKKANLLKRVVTTIERSPLRSGARQRLAAIRMDEGDIDGAWEAFQLAQRDAPDAPSLGLLEVQLLMAQRRPAAAADRARFWTRRLRSRGYPESEGVLPLLDQVARDPERALAELGIEISGGAGTRLLAWLERVSDREVPVYYLSDEPPNIAGNDVENFENALADRLRELGVPEAELPSLVGDLELPEEPGERPGEGPGSDFLVAQAEIQSTEQDWHTVFPLGKPFSVNILAPDDDVWSPSVESEWMNFLESHDAAFDSLDILDDLANAVHAHEHSLMAGFDELLLRPILQRAQSIIQRAVDRREGLRLAWVHTENRPALRCLVNLSLLEERLGNESTMIEIAEQVLALNPNDNHGLRTMIINDRLRRHDDIGTLEIAENYPADLNPDIAYGQALALFRLGRTDDADVAVQEAIVDLPNVVRYLLAKRIRKPKLDPVGIRIGGDDQAWLYRQEMRDVWEATPGALDWLKGHRPA